VRISARSHQCAAKRKERQCLRIHRNCINNGPVIHPVLLGIDREGRPFSERATPIALELIQQKRGLVRRVRIPGIPECVAEIPLSGAPVLIEAGLREDFDPAISQLVVLRRERILIDANFTDGLLGRQLPAAESIDEDGSAIGTGGGTGKRLQIRREIIRIVRQGIEVGSAQHQGARITRRIRAQGGGGSLLNRHFLCHRFDLQHQVQYLRPGFEVDFHRLQLR
jgi:hypothetical protein